jgi:hypothetical protein
MRAALAILNLCVCRRQGARVRSQSIFGAALVVPLPITSYVGFPFVECMALWSPLLIVHLGLVWGLGLCESELCVHVE